MGNFYFGKIKLASTIAHYLGNYDGNMPDKYKQEGRQTGKFDIAKNILHECSESGFIESVTGLPMEFIWGLQIA